jgi:hypothetical protein
MNHLMAAQATHAAAAHNNEHRRPSIINKFNDGIGHPVRELFEAARELSFDCKKFLYRFIFCIVLRCLRSPFWSNCGTSKLIDRINCVTRAINNVIKDITDIAGDQGIITVDRIKTQIRNECSPNKKWFDEVILKVNQLRKGEPDFDLYYGPFWLDLLPLTETEVLILPDYNATAIEHVHVLEGKRISDGEDSNVIAEATTIGPVFKGERISYGEDVNVIPNTTTIGPVIAEVTPIDIPLIESYVSPPYMYSKDPPDRGRGRGGKSRNKRRIKKKSKRTKKRNRRAVTRRKKH